MAGWVASAVAAALGTAPMPASFEKRPRLMPVMRAMPKPAPRTASKSKAQRTIVTSTSGTIVMLSAVTASATRM